MTISEQIDIAKVDRRLGVYMGFLFVAPHIVYFFVQIFYLQYPEKYLFLEGLHKVAPFEYFSCEAFVFAYPDQIVRATAQYQVPETVYLYRSAAVLICMLYVVLALAFLPKCTRDLNSYFQYQIHKSMRNYGANRRWKCVWVIALVVVLNVFSLYSTLEVSTPLFGDYISGCARLFGINRETGVEFLRYGDHGMLTLTMFSIGTIVLVASFIPVFLKTSPTTETD